MSSSLVHLEYFRVAARHEHITRAAEELRITQPSLSRAIAQLERDFGVRLFDRVGRRIRLNRYGETLLQSVDRTSRELEEVRRELLDLSGSEAGYVRLTVHAGTQLLPDLLARFRQKHPNIRFSVFQRNASEAFKQLQQGEVDLCISCPPPQILGLEAVDLVTEEIVLAVPPDHWAADRGRAQLRELADEPFISLKPGYNLRNVSDNLMRREGLDFHFAFEGDNPAVIPNLIRSGLGIGFVPYITWNSAIESSLSLLRLENEKVERTLGLAWRSYSYSSRAEREFRRFVVDYFSEY